MDVYLRVKYRLVPTVELPLIDLVVQKLGRLLQLAPGECGCKRHRFFAHNIIFNLIAPHPLLSFALPSCKSTRDWEVSSSVNQKILLTNFSI